MTDFRQPQRDGLHAIGEALSVTPNGGGDALPLTAWFVSEPRELLGVDSAHPALVAMDDELAGIGVGATFTRESVTWRIAGKPPADQPSGRVVLRLEKP